MRPLKGPYRSTKSGDYPRRYRPRCLRVGEARRDVSADSATRHAGNCHGGIATSITGTEQSSFFAALLGRVYRRQQAISDEPRGASCEMGGRPFIINEYCL